MGLLRFLLGLLAAAAIHVLGLRTWGAFVLYVDPILVLVIYHSVGVAPLWAILGGSAAGLTADALSGGTYGLFGFTNTLVAYACARLQRHLVIQRAERLLLFFAVGAIVHLLLLGILQVLLVNGAELPPPAAVLIKTLTTSLLGVGMVLLGRRWTAWLGGRRQARARKLTLDRR